ncbi:hypothetical protein TWF730_007926 [Orbilia blumenaviensis]|uniref:DNA recombination and repair protein Rad51-like C-terminal domain-containing protein n=1 Tax=Orbilia blumenaviensis TaxID=1796055 RepID=A0AAV9VBV1_9PEZI
MAAASEGMKVGLGKRLLMEVGKSEESLSNLLSDIQLTAQHHNASGGPLHIPQIDTLLRPHLQDHLHNLSIVQAQSQHPAGSFDIPLDEIPLPRDKPAIIEISSDGCGTGKTHLLYYTACMALLPPSWNGVNLEGKDTAVIFIDCDSRFDVVRMSEVIQSYIQSRILLAVQFCESKQPELPQDHTEEGIQNPITSSQVAGEEISEYLALLNSLTAPDVTEFVVHCLSHLHVYTPTSPSHFLEILSSIPEYLISSPSHSSHDTSMSTLIIDDISAFYWLERASSASTAVSATSFSDPTSQSAPQNGVEVKGLHEEGLKEEDKEQNLTLQDRYDLITSHLLRIASRFNANIIITNTVVSTSSSHPTQANNNTPAHPRHLPACYTYSPKFLSARIILSKDVVAPFHADIRISEAYNERDMRMGVVKKAGISAWVEGAGVRKGEGRKKSGGWFWFRIGEDGVTVGAEEEG